MGQVAHRRVAIADSRGLRPALAGAGRARQAPAKGKGEKGDKGEGNSGHQRQQQHAPPKSDGQCDYCHKAGRKTKDYRKRIADEKNRGVSQICTMPSTPIQKLRSGIVSDIFGVALRVGVAGAGHR